MLLHPYISYFTFIYVILQTITLFGTGNIKEKQNSDIGWSNCKCGSRVSIFPIDFLIFFYFLFFDCFCSVRRYKKGARQRKLLYPHLFSFHIPHIYLFFLLLFSFHPKYFTEQIISFSQQFVHNSLTVQFLLLRIVSILSSIAIE